MIRPALAVRALTVADARELASWRYPAPYSIYDADTDDWQRYLDPAWDYHAIADERGDLVAHCCFGADARVPGGAYDDDDAIDVGGGIRPVLTGSGLGPAFLDAIAAAAQQRFPQRALRATVAAFNTRALRLLIRAGFVEVERFPGPEHLEFVVMLRRQPEQR